MKKLFYIFASAIVALGAVACQNDIDETIENNQDKGFSITANIDDLTRVELSDKDADNNRKLTWTDGDILEAEMLDEEGKVADIRHFSYSGNNTFTCYDDDAKAWVENQLASQGFINFYYKRSAGMGEYNEVDKYQFMLMGALIVDGDAITMEATQTIFHFTTGADDVTLKYLASSGLPEEFTVKANGEYYMGVYVGQNITLEAYVGDEKIKEKTNCTFEAGKIYNLGHLEKAAPTPDATWGIAGEFQGWAAATPEPLYANGDVLVAYNLTGLDKGFKFVKNKKWDESCGATVETAIATNVWNNCGDKNITAPDAAAYDVYFAPEAKLFCLVTAGGDVPVIPEKQPTVWSLAGSFNDWSDTLMTETTTANLHVVKNVELTTGDEIKVKDSTTWDVSFGGGITNLNTNSWMKVYANGSNIVVAASGKYDVYFEYNEGGEYSKLYLIEAEGDYTAATEQTANGTLIPDTPDTPEVTPDVDSVWSVSGTFNNWGDVVMVTTTVKDVYVAKSVKLDAYASFKVRKNKAWTESYGGGIVYMNPNGYIQVYANGSDISNTAAGTFDIYFNYAKKFLYLVDAGTDYTTVALQSKEGKEPEQEEPEVTEKALYLKPNANWKQSNARFAAYIWGGTAGEIWVSMTDSDKDGIYEMFIPEGYDYGCNIIFCRMNPATTANNWNNKWNQTSDLKAPTDGKNLYTVKESTWDKGGGTWSVK